MSSLEILKYSFRLCAQKVVSLRAAGAYLILVFYSSLLETPVKEFLAANGYRIAPWIFPHFLSNGSYQLVIAFCCIYFFSDTPFFTQSQMYQLNRCGRVRWMAAHILGMMESACVFALVCYFATVVVMIPHLEWNARWGAVIKTLALTDVAELYTSPVTFSYPLITRFLPFAATGIACVLTAFLAMFLGLVMLGVGLAGNRILAAAAATAIPMWSVIVYNMGMAARQKLSYFAPVLWLGIADVENKIYGMWIQPPYAYIFGFLIAAILVLSGLSLVFVQKKDCVFENEDQ